MIIVLVYLLQLVVLELDDIVRIAARIESVRSTPQ
jgi:hypothetical protein